ncbi:hypothetical protein QBC43DRAFT_306852 [Cladorrhinum sp. PSN259]|nr:hypothetical protein QBC43DRAFT_306852 [Cladorrhinum sp. PSN259]
MTSHEIYDATIACRRCLESCQPIEALSRDGWAENRLADFNLWAAGVGAGVTHQASLDRRLDFHPKVRLVLTGLLMTVTTIFGQCKAIALREDETTSPTTEPSAPAEDSQPSPPSPSDESSLSPSTQQDHEQESASAWFNSLVSDSENESSDESGSDDGAHQDQNTSLQDAMKDAESGLDQLLRLGLAIRKSGTTARLQKADKSFKETDYKDFQRYLAITLKLDTQEVEEHGNLGKTTDERMESLVANSFNELTVEQKHFVFANLRRRHRFFYARRHHQKLAQLRQQPKLLTSSMLAQAAIATPTAPLPSEHQSQGGFIQVKASQAPSQVSKSSKWKESAAMTEIFDRHGLTLTNPSAAEGDILARVTPSAPSQVASRVSITTARLNYPLPPPTSAGLRSFKCPCCYQTLPIMFLEKSRWRKHIAEDLCPYTCPFPDCPTPNILYATRKVWRHHIETHHGSSRSWECLACVGDQSSKRFLSLDEFTAHVRAQHGETITEQQIATLQDTCCIVSPPSFELCPLCRCRPAGPDGGLTLDPTAILDHVGDCIHDFSLKALPWAEIPQGREDEIPAGYKAVIDGKVSAWQETIVEEPPADMEGAAAGTGNPEQATLKIIDTGTEKIIDDPAVSGSRVMKFIPGEYFAEGSENNATQTSRDNSMSFDGRSVEKVGAKDPEGMMDFFQSQSSEQENVQSLPYPVYETDSQFPAATPVSPALQEISRGDRTSWTRFRLADLIGHMVEASRNYFGSLFIVHHLKEASDLQIDVVFEEIHPLAIELMKSYHGSSVIQTFFRIGNFHTWILGNRMTGNMVELSMHPFAYRVVTTAVKSLKASESNQIKWLMREFDLAPPSFMTHENAPEIIDAMLAASLLPDSIVHQVRRDIRHLARNRYGSRVILKILEGAQDPIILSYRIKDHILLHSKKLAINVYGQRVLRKVLCFNQPHGKQSHEDWLKMKKLVKDHFVTFSMDKVARILVLDVIAEWPSNERNSLCHWLIGKIENEDLLLHLLKNEEYGRSVIYKAIGIMKEVDRDDLVRAIKRAAPGFLPDDWETLARGRGDIPAGDLGNVRPLSMPAGGYSDERERPSYPSTMQNTRVAIASGPQLSHELKDTKVPLTPGGLCPHCARNGDQVWVTTGRVCIYHPNSSRFP